MNKDLNSEPDPAKTEEMIKILKPCLILSGTWTLGVTKSKFINLLYSLYSRISNGIFLIFLILLAAKLVQLIQVQASTDILYGNIAILVTSSAAGIKICIYRINNVPNMFQNVINEEKGIWLSNDKDLEALYRSKVNFCRKLNLGIISFDISAILAMFLMSIVNFVTEDKSVKLTEKQLIEKSFMYPVWLPFLESAHMPSVFLVNIVIVSVGVPLFGASQMIFGTLMVFAATQLELLQIKIKKLDEKNRFEGDNGDDFIEELAVEHSAIIEFVKKLNNSIKYVILLDFILNSFNVASVAIQVLRAVTFLEILFPFTYLLIMVMQVFLIGWLSNEVKVQGLAIADSLFNTNWYNNDLIYKKKLLFMISRSQKFLKISIGPFGPMTIETALGTMKAAYSFITIMQNYK